MTVTVEVMGSNADDMVENAKTLALEFFGVSEEYEITVRDFDATPHIMTGDGVPLNYQATITLARVPIEADED